VDCTEVFTAFRFGLNHIGTGQTEEQTDDVQRHYSGSVECIPSRRDSADVVDDSRIIRGLTGAMRPGESVKACRPGVLTFSIDTTGQRDVLPSGQEVGQQSFHQSFNSDCPSAIAI